MANPSDILLFHQRKRNQEGEAPTREKRARNPLSMPVIPDVTDVDGVEDLVAQQLRDADRKMQLLTEADMKDALEVGRPPHLDY